MTVGSEHRHARYIRCCQSTATIRIVNVARPAQIGGPVELVREEATPLRTVTEAPHASRLLFPPAAAPKRRLAIENTADK